MQIKFDIAQMAEDFGRKLDAIKNPEYLLRPVAFDLVALMTQRIHEQGTGSDDAKIKDTGYTESYLKYRQKKHNRDGSRLVIISLTRQLENDWSVVAIKNGYGIGFKNSHNRDKARWVSAMFQKGGNSNRIFALSKSEQQYAQKKWGELIQDALRN